jgi:hypothetical protein
VWEYRTRPQNAESLLRIQQVETGPAGAPVYHFSLAGIRIDGMPGDTMPHLPVSAATLDASVTRLSTRTPDFPDPAEGIATWRAAKGGVFTIPVADIVDIIQKTIDGQRD